MNGKDNDINIHWFPGHMAKTRRMIEENLKITDAVVELTDARIPEAGRNGLLNELIGNKPRVLLLNKRDYADNAVTEQWLKFYRNSGLYPLACDCRAGTGLKELFPLIGKSVGGRKRHGALRVMVAGIPNVGKSSFINRMAGSKKAAVGDKPGITRGKQWIRITAGAETVELLDTPGILPPRLDDKNAALMLAFTGAVKSEVMDTETLAYKLADYLKENYPERLKERYKLTNLDGDIIAVIESIAESRGMLIAGGEPDNMRACAVLLDEFKGGKIGKISLEKPAVPV